MNAMLVVALVVLLFIATYAVVQNMLMRMQQRAVYNFMMMLRSTLVPDVSMNTASPGKAQSSGGMPWLLTLVAVLIFLLWLLPQTL